MNSPILAGWSVWMGHYRHCLHREKTVLNPKINIDALQSALKRLSLQYCWRQNQNQVSSQKKLKNQSKKTKKNKQKKKKEE